MLTGPSSAFHYVIHMRSDAGPPGGRRRGSARPCSSAPTTRDSSTRCGPDWRWWATGRRWARPTATTTWTRPRSTTPNKAKELLAEAGYASDLTITLYAQQALEVPAIATVWKEQMKAIGVTVNIQTVPPDVYYGEGDASWLKVDFGITEWGARATPNAYFNAAYVTGAAYNESHWSDPEFDALAAQINSELDRTKRVDLYKQAQQILIERGPVIVPFFETAAAGTSASRRRASSSRPTGRAPCSARAYFSEVTEKVEADAGRLRPAAGGAAAYWRRLRRQPVALAGTVIFVLFLLMAIFGPLVAPYDYADQNVGRAARRRPAWPTSSAPTTSGATSSAGCWWEPARSSTSGGVGTLLAAVIGTSLGLLAGYAGRLWDEAIMRLLDVLLAFPALLLAMVLLATTGPSNLNLILVITVALHPDVRPHRPQHGARPAHPGVRRGGPAARREPQLHPVPGDAAQRRCRRCWWRRRCGSPTPSSWWPRWASWAWACRRPRPTGDCR